jgi:chromosomal replication initiation ATPase DnaA
MIKLIDIERAVCQVFEITPEQLKKKGQKRDEFTPRHIAMLASRELTIMSFESIGKYFGGHNHDLAMKAVKSISSAIETDSKLMAVFIEVCELAKKISSKDRVKQAIVNDLKTYQRKLSSGNFSRSKHELAQIILNIETLL